MRAQADSYVEARCATSVGLTRSVNSYAADYHILAYGKAPYILLWDTYHGISTFVGYFWERTARVKLALPQDMSLFVRYLILPCIGDANRPLIPYIVKCPTIVSLRQTSTERPLTKFNVWLEACGSSTFRPAFHGLHREAQVEKPAHI